MTTGFIRSDIEEIFVSGGDELAFPHDSLVEASKIKIINLIFDDIESSISC